jgi:hypothetical protein
VQALYGVAVAIQICRPQRLTCPLWICFKRETPHPTIKHANTPTNTASTQHKGLQVGPKSHVAKMLVAALVAGGLQQRQQRKQCASAVTVCVLTHPSTHPSMALLNQSISHVSNNPHSVSSTFVMLQAASLPSMSAMAPQNRVDPQYQLGLHQTKPCCRCRCHCCGCPLKCSHTLTAVNATTAAAAVLLLLEQRLPN